MKHTNFTMISNDLIFDNVLPPKAKALYGLLASRAQLNKMKMCRIGIRKIQKILLIGSSHTVMKLLSILESEKWIEKAPHTQGNCNVYKVYFNKNSNTPTKNYNTSITKNTTDVMLSEQPINIDEDIIEYEDLSEWNIQQLNN